MATLRIHQFPDNLLDDLRKIAELRGLSLNAYISEILQQAVENQNPRRKAEQTLLEIKSNRRPLSENAPDVVDLIRKFRNGGA